MSAEAEDDQGERGEARVAGERLPPHRSGAKLAEAPAIGSLAPGEGASDCGREEDEQPERAKGGPPGRSLGQKGDGDCELDNGEGHRTRAGPSGRDAEARERLARPAPIRQLGDPRAGEDGREDQARAEEDGIHGGQSTLICADCCLQVSGRRVTRTGPLRAPRCLGALGSGLGGAGQTLDEGPWPGSAGTTPPPW